MLFANDLGRSIIVGWPFRGVAFKLNARARADFESGYDNNTQ